MNTSTMSKRPSTHIWPWDEHINHVRKAQHSHLTMGWTHQPCQKGLALTSNHGMNTSTISERLTDSSLPLWRTSIWRTPSFSLKYSNFTLANGLVNTSAILLVRNNILELHCSSRHHILDIVIFDLNMLRLVMEHWVLWQLHTTLVVKKDTSFL